MGAVYLHKSPHSYLQAPKTEGKAMPKLIIPLTDMKVDKAKPQTKEVKMYDGGGLYLLLTPKGGKLWNLKYRFGGKEKKLAFGAFPLVSLESARHREYDKQANSKR